MLDEPKNEPTPIEDPPTGPASTFDTGPLGDPPGPDALQPEGDPSPGQPTAESGEPGGPDDASDPNGVDTQAAVAFDSHSQPVPTPSSAPPRSPEEIIRAEAVAVAQPTPGTEPPTSPPDAATAPAAPVQAVVDTAVGTAKQAAQQVTVAVDTAKQAAQQVTAAVQQGAQKITVAPRKALYRGKRFLWVYGGAVGAAGILAFFARKHRYFVGDVGITRMIQTPSARLYDRLMHAVSELGWRWISVGARASTGTLMWAAGFRMESAFTFSTWSGDVLTVLIKTRVLRPRPTKDLVRVLGELEEASFPSGHVVHYVTFYGFLFYLVFTHLKQRWFRTALLTLLAGVILLIGPSRVYMGHHWPSDVGGAYLVGTLWLGLIIIAYIETKANYTLHTTPPFFVKRPKQLG
ncbi:MAG: phosphatase PAP2 family protein [Chloroflexia bacterium]